MSYERDLFNRLRILARGFDNYYEFAASEEDGKELNDFLAYRKEVDGDYFRPTAFMRFKRIECYAYDTTHPGTMWKVFRIGNDEKCAYTLDGEGLEEEESTIGFLAYENHCSRDFIEVGYEYREARK